jgi:hypothetical protein
MNQDDQVYAEPSEVEAVDGKVEVDGPDAVDVALTPGRPTRLRFASSATAAVASVEPSLRTRISSGPG